jgi:hypothetical protein
VSNKNSYLDDMKEWQDHQFDPGYYTGGKIPYWKLNPGKPKNFAFLCFLIAIIDVFCIIGIIYYNLTGSEPMWEQQITTIIFLLLIAIFSSLAGIRNLKKQKKIYTKKKKRS